MSTAAELELEDEPRRVDFSDLGSWGKPELDAAWEKGRAESGAALARYGVAVGSEVIDARKFTSKRGRVRLRTPPSGWRFLDGVRQAQLADRPPGELLGELERREWESFWLWYLPLEVWTLELCDLVRFFHKRRREDDHAQRLDALCAVASELRQQLMQHENDQRIPWLPQRLGWGPRGNREQMTIVGLLGKHLIEFDGATPEPPAWTQEPLPRSPFDE